VTQGSEDRYLLLPSTAMYDLDFVLRIRAGLERRGWRLVVVTHLISVMFRARREAIPCVMIRSDRRAPDVPTIPIEQTHEGRQGLLSASRAQRYSASAWAALQSACERYPVAGVVQWNGQGLTGKLATAFARRLGLATLFIELGNVDGKTFVDPCGVSGAALVASRPDLLDRYAVPDSEIETWRQRLIQDHDGGRPIPQSRGLGKINPWYPVNVIGGALLGLPAPASAGLWMRVQRQLGVMRRSRTPVVKPPARFVFLPLQVSSDTNLLLFSDHDAFSALAAAEKRAEELGVQLVIKPHPAERNMALLGRLRRVCQARGHVWTGANTLRLIQAADEIVTINSTVGLTARALGRPLIILGQSVYGAFTPRQTAVFALRHLVDIDPFDTAPASQPAIDHILAVMALPADQSLPSKSNPALRSAIRS
jgi:capsular polysaccharide export protein